MKFSKVNPINDPISQIEEFKSQNEWIKIAAFLNSEDYFNTDIADFKLCKELLYAYGKIATNMIDKEYKTGLKFYSLFITYARYLLQRKNLTDNDKFSVYDSVAYNSYSLYINNRIWASRFKKENSNVNIKEADRREIFNKAVLRVKALSTHRLLLEKKPNHIKLNYRMGKLIDYVKTEATYGKSKVDITFYVGENCTNTQSRFYIWASDLYEKITGNYYPELYYYNKAISLYEKIDENNKKDKDWNRKEYIKSLYRFCSICTDAVYKYNIGLLGIGENILTNVKNRESQYPLKINAFEEQMKVRDYLFRIIKLENIPLKNVVDQAKRISQEDLAVQANFVYYRIAKYLLAYRVQLGESKQIPEVVKYLYYSLLVDFFIAIDKRHRKTTNKAPYNQFSLVMSCLGLNKELFEIANKYMKKSPQLYNFTTCLGTSYRKIIDGDFSDAKEKLNKLAEIADRDKAMGKIVKMLQKELDGYLKAGDNRKEVRKYKQEAIIAKNTLMELGFPK